MTEKPTVFEVLAQEPSYRIVFLKRCTSCCQDNPRVSSALPLTDHSILVPSHLRDKVINIRMNH